MKKLLLGLAVMPFLAGVSLAAQPAPLSDKQMDKVTAGFDFTELKIQNGGTVWVGINTAPTTILPGAYLNIVGTVYPAGVNSFQLQAQFGP